MALWRVPYTFSVKHDWDTKLISCEIIMIWNLFVIKDGKIFLCPPDRIFYSK